MTLRRLKNASNLYFYTVQRSEYLFLGKTNHNLIPRSHSEAYNPIKTFSTVKGASADNLAFGLKAFTAWLIAK